MVSSRVLGAALSPLLFAHAPIVLLLMSPFLVNMVCVAPLLGAATYFPVALAITVLQCTVGFMFGNVYGQRALAWVVARTPLSETRADLFLNFVRRGSVFALFAVPGPILGTVAGVAGIRRRTFFLAVVPAQALWVTAAYFIGEALLHWIEIARNFVTAHTLELTAVTLSVVGLRWLYTRFAGKEEDAVTLEPE